MGQKPLTKSLAENRCFMDSCSPLVSHILLVDGSLEILLDFLKAIHQMPNGTSGNVIFDFLKCQFELSGDGLDSTVSINETQRIDYGFVDYGFVTKGRWQFREQLKQLTEAFPRLRFEYRYSSADLYLYGESFEL